VTNFLAVTAFSFGAVVLLMAATAWEGRRQGRVSVVDTTWGLGFVVVAAVAGVVGDGTGWRRLVLFVVVALWGLRLAGHMHRRNSGKGEDPRYVELLSKEDGNPTLVAVRKVYAVQGLAVWFVSLPIQVSAASGRGVVGVVVVGLVLWVLGIAFEALGDRQLREFKAHPANQGKVMDRGLWSWTRHPNYFGDACVWWGIWLVAASAWPGVLTLFSPLAMTYFLVFATGARLLERHLGQRPGYAAYQQRTSYFLPRPPRR
jgi:steroid 5-alpha reductase family enzyme